MAALFGNRTLRTQGSSFPRHFGTTLVGQNCPDISALVPKCLLDTSDLSAEVSYPCTRTEVSRLKVRSVSPGHTKRRRDDGTVLDGRHAAVMCPVVALYENYSQRRRWRWQQHCRPIWHSVQLDRSVHSWWCVTHHRWTGKHHVAPSCVSHHCIMAEHFCHRMMTVHIVGDVAFQLFLQMVHLPPYTGPPKQKCYNQPGWTGDPSRTLCLHIVPRSYTWLGDRSFSVVGPRIWNILHASLRPPDIEFGHFKRLLRAFLFGKKSKL